MSDEQFIGTPSGHGILRISGDNVTFENMTLPDHIQIQGAGTTFVNCVFGAVRKSTCCGFYPAWTDEGVEVCASCMTPVSEQPTSPQRVCEWCEAPEGQPCMDTCGCTRCEITRALDDDADMHVENGKD